MKTSRLFLLMFLIMPFLLPETSNGDTVVFQDFETPSGWNGANPPPNWSIVDYGTADGTWDNYDWFNYSAWGGRTARVSGAIQSRYNNDWLISQVVDFGAASACTLFFRHYYDDVVSQAADSALVMLSNNGGSTWGDTVIIYAGSDIGSDAAPDSEYFNISSFVAGHSSVKVAFQYVKRQAIVAGGWRIDDIKFRADGASLMHQDFESSWGPYGNNPPSNWTINDINVVRWDDNDWHQASAAGWGNVADVYWSPVEQQNEMLISQAMDFSDGTNDIRMSLKQWYDDGPDNSDSAMILGSIDGGVSWPETLAIYRGSDWGGLTSPAYDTLHNIYEWANYESNVKFGFKYVGNDDGRWYLDSIRIERIDNFNYDATIAAILSPPLLTIQGYTIPVTVKVENIGLFAATFNVTLMIVDTAGTTVYNQTQAVVNLPGLQQRDINFPFWIANEPYTHEIKCFTTLFNDQDHSNDTLITTTYTYPHVGSGGPVEGWSFKDNVTGGGPSYQWIDIRSSGTEIGFSDPDNGNSGMIEMGMNFEYFWSSYHRIAVSVDGWLSFIDSTSSDNSHSVIPDPDGPAGMIALLWKDLNLGSGHVYYHFNSSTNQFIVQYDSVEFAGVPGADIGMEVIFDGDDNTIKMQYKYFAGGSDSDITIGIENQVEDIGLPYNNAGEPGQIPLPGLAITYKYSLPHDVRIIAIDQPTMLLHGGDIIDIVVRFRNSGAATESFIATAVDNFGYSNTQTITNLESLDSITVTFPNWAITNECSTYALSVFANLGGDMDRSNDTLFEALVATPPANTDFVYDSGQIVAAEYYLADSVLAAGFNVIYGDAIISAIAFRFGYLNEFPTLPDSTRDSVYVHIFHDLNSDDQPDPLATYTSKILPADSGWTFWNVACETTITVNCGTFWAGYSNDLVPGEEPLCLDNNGVSYPESKWLFDGSAWQIDSAFPGDLMIRAYLDCDPSTAPNLAPETYLVTGAALPHDADTVTTYFQNTGTACDLSYKVSVIQTITSDRPGSLGLAERVPAGVTKVSTANVKLLPGFRPREPDDPPVIFDAGGPDDFGYTWIDSDEPTGPDYYWLDIITVGTEVTWDHGNSDDGHTEPIPMGMAFSYYGANYDSIVISSNGWVSFLRAPDDAFVFIENNPLPAADELLTTLAVDWDNLDGGTSGHCYYYRDEAANSFVVSWINWSHKPAPTNQHSFQLVLNATDGTIVFQYGSGTYQDDITIGIENEAGDDGQMVTFNQPYVHSDLTVLFSPPIFWLSTDVPNGVLPPLSGPVPFNIFMYAHDLPTGTYNGAIVLTSNDVDQPVSIINVQFEIEGVCAYIPGDVNSSGTANGVDITFMVNFFKGGDPPHEECLPCSSLGGNMLYPQGDVNGNCTWNGIDVTYFVAYLKGIGQPIRYCDNCAPAGGGGLVNRSVIIPSLVPAINRKNGVSKIQPR